VRVLREPDGDQAGRHRLVGERDRRGVPEIARDRRRIRHLAVRRPPAVVGRVAGHK